MSNYCQVAVDYKQQKILLEWIRKMSLNYNCIKSVANHDIDIKSRIIKL